MRKNIILICIVLFGAILRIYSISSTPPSLNWDEISHGYNAYSVMKTGLDEWGKLPFINFRAYGDYPLTLNLYLTIPFIFIFKLSEFSIRLPHALLGIGTILASYFLALGIFKKKHIALLVAFLVSIEPWHLFSSRFVLQGNLSVFLLILAMALFFNREKRKLFLPLSLFVFILTLFSYHTARIFSPIFLFTMVVLYWPEFKNKVNLILIGLFAILALVIFLDPTSRARSNEVFIINQGAINKIEELRNTSPMPDLASKIFYNRATYLVEQSFAHYVEYFSPSFLFLNGGTQYQFSVPGYGLLFPVSLPFFYIGLFAIFSKAVVKRNKTYLLLLFWLLIGPIPASITTERYAVLRATSMLPVPEIATAIGFFATVEFLKRYWRNKELLTGAFIFLNLLFLGFYLKNYFINYKTDYSWAWQYGYKQAVLFVKENYDSYDNFIITKKYGEPHEYLLFYLSWDPQSYRNDTNLVRYTQSNWWWVDSFNKFTFVNDWQIPKNGQEFVTEKGARYSCETKRCALITSPDNAPKDWKRLQTINFLDGKAAFQIYENK